MANQANAVAFRLEFAASCAKIQGRYRFGLLQGGMDVSFTGEFVRLDDFTAFCDEFRMIDADTMIGKWVEPEVHPPLARALADYLEPSGGRFAFYYILTRV